MSETRVLIPHDEILKRINELAKELCHDYKSKELLLIAVLNGAMPFATNLLQALWHAGHHDVSLDSVTVSSYGNEKTSNKTPKLLKQPTEPLNNRHVLVADDIIDTGHTLLFLKELFQKEHPATLRTITLLSKPARREVPVEPDYIGFVIEDTWVEGFGLDTEGRGRGNPDIIERT